MKAITNKYSPKIQLTDEELSSLTLAIKERFKIDFTNYEKKSIKRSLSKIIQKNHLGSSIALWSRIMGEKSFFHSIVDDLTINLTEFFRDPEIWRYLYKEILPGYIFKKKLNVWHAGCSTGEEVYSMALIVQQVSLTYKTKVVASDLSKRVLEKAEKGVYPKELQKKYEKVLLESIPHAAFSDMFFVLDEHIKVKEVFKRNIQFRKHNLVSDTVFQKFDIIFCRNVMIYFDEDLKINVLHKLYDCLNDDGYLILGYYDMFPQECRKMFELCDARSKVFKKIV